MERDSTQDLALASAEVGALIARIRPEQWAGPTPCAEWSVWGVVNHIVGLNLVFTAMLTSGPMPERGVDILGEDPLGAYRESNAALQRAFGEPGVLAREFPGPLGTATGAERLQIRLTDLITHGWDLRQATGIELRIPEEMAEHALAFIQVQMATQNRAGRFGEPRRIAESAPALDRLAAFLGRSVG
ncbi:TIGR03086 family metal-binding protein [Tomitella biformata]|uniref:TIGR03086 family metal-binding protein n=1 Tax=Tomitella biformata TaxID=630403 RepID=UPI000465354F|nr:TIGR03086 family metal-binding protein [Tomitella biformata]